MAQVDAVVGTRADIRSCIMARYFKLYKSGDIYKAVKNDAVYKGFSYGSDDTPAYGQGNILVNEGNLSTLWNYTLTLYPGTYELTLVGSGGSASNGYYYWPAGKTGDTLVCTIRITAKSVLTASIGGQTASYGKTGANSTVSINSNLAITCGGGGKNGISINSNNINIISTTTSNSTGGSSSGGSGANPAPLSPWGDGGYTYSAEGRGGGLKIKCLTIT